MKISQDQFLKAELEILNLTMSNAEFVALAESVAEYISQYAPESVIDFGCGTGVYSEVARQKGYNIVAQDIFKSHRDYCKSNYPDLTVVAKPTSAELMLFIEVAEHMTNGEIAVAVSKINPKFILFSSTPHTTDNDDRWGHINIKQEYEWSEFWRELGFEVIDRPKTPTLWAMMLRRI